MQNFVQESNCFQLSLKNGSIKLKLNFSKKNCSLIDFRTHFEFVFYFVTFCVFFPNILETKMVAKMVRKK